MLHQATVLHELISFTVPEARHRKGPHFPWALTLQFIVVRRSREHTVRMIVISAPSNFCVVSLFVVPKYIDQPVH